MSVCTRRGVSQGYVSLVDVGHASMPPVQRRFSRARAENIRRVSGANLYSLSMSWGEDNPTGMCTLTLHNLDNRMYTKHSAV